MPSGKVHDRITIFVALPLSAVAGAMSVLLDDALIPAIAIAGHLFSGWMFGPDLDCRSLHYKRWIWLRWIWLPYQKAISHRATLSHGFAIGTSFRIIYLMAWLHLPIFGYFAIRTAMLQQGWQWFQSSVLMFWQDCSAWGQFNVLLLIALWCGLECGAMSHYLADAIVSAWKRKMKYKREKI